MNRLSSITHIARQGFRHFRGCFSMGADDIVLASFPRSGSTWFRTVFANAISLKNGVNENTHMRDLESVMPVLGFSDLSKAGPEFYRPRLIKTHRLPGQIKPFRPRQVLHLWRQSTDVMKSCFRYYSASRATTIEDNISEYIRNPKFGLPAWREHLDDWMPVATVSLQYESMRADTAGEISRVLKEMGYHELLPFVEQAVALASVENMRKSEATIGVRDPDRFVADFASIGAGATDKTTLSDTDQAYINSLSHGIASK